MEKAITTPHRKEYTGPRFDLSKEALQKTIEEIEKMDAATVKKRLGKYERTDLNSRVTNDINTFEMMALYQKALELLGSKVTINARFSPTTHSALRGVQEKTLKMTGKEIDGLPGSNTTKALIKALEEKSTSIQPVVTKPAVAPVPVATPASTPIPAPAASASAKPVSAPVPITVVPASPSSTVPAISIPASASASVASASASASAPKASVASEEQISKEKEAFLRNQITKFLINEGYTQQSDGTFLSKDKDLTITIKDGKVEFTRDPLRVFGDWGLNTDEKLIIATIESYLRRNLSSN